MLRQKNAWTRVPVRLLLVVSLLAAMLVGILQQAGLAAAATDDYPWSGATTLNASTDDYGYSTCPSNDSGCMGSTYVKSGVTYGEYDPWNYDLRNCTSFVAWRISQVFGKSIAGWGNANHWAVAAGNAGYSTDPLTAPQVGDIAEWDTGGGGYGHVAYVYAVSGSVASFEEYNYANTGVYSNNNTSNTEMPDHYIHIGTVSGSSGGTPTSSRLGVVSTASGQQDVFWKGSDSNLWEAYWDGAAWHKYNLGFGDLHSAPTAVIQPSTGYIEVFWQGPGNNLYQAVWNGGAWVGNWNLNVGATVFSQPTASAFGSQVDVYWKDSTNKLQEAVWNGSAWVGFNLGSNFWNMGSAPSASDLPSGQNDVYWADSAGNLIEAVWNGSAWASFALPVGLISSQPSGLYEPTSGFQDVFWKDGSNLKEAVWNGSAWVTFNIGMGTLATAPSVTAWGSQVDVYWTDSSGNLDEAVWNGSAWVNFQIPGMGPIPVS